MAPVLACGFETVGGRWLGREGGGGGWLESALCRGRGSGVGGVDVEEVLRPEIKFCLYLSSMVKWAHVLSDPVLSTPGMMSRRLWTMDFFFMLSTTPLSLLWLHHAVRSLVGRWSSELCASFTMKVSCRYAIYFSMLGILKNFLLTVSFVMCWSYTVAILMPNMRRMLWCRNTSIFFKRVVRLLRLSTLAYVQNLRRAPIDAFPATRCASML